MAELGMGCGRGVQPDQNSIRMFSPRYVVALVGTWTGLWKALKKKRLLVLARAPHLGRRPLRFLYDPARKALGSADISVATGFSGGHPLRSRYSLGIHLSSAAIADRGPGG